MVLHHLTLNWLATCGTAAVAAATAAAAELRGTRGWMSNTPYYPQPATVEFESCLHLHLESQVSNALAHLLLLLF